MENKQGPLNKAIPEHHHKPSGTKEVSWLLEADVIPETGLQFCYNDGFTEEEVFAVMDAQSFDPKLKEDVKFWCDGFSFGSVTDIYNPWSVISFLESEKLDT